MAIVDIISEHDGKTGEWSLDGGFRLTVQAYVMTDDPKTGPETFLRALGLNVGDTYRYPLTGTPTETNATLFLQSINILGIDEDGRCARLGALFSRNDPSKDDRGPVDEDGNRDPFAAPPKLRWASDVEEFAHTHDKDGTPILNTAGDPPSEPIITPVSVPTAIVSRMVREFDTAWIDSFRGRINATEWLGWPAGSVMCKEITADREWLPDVQGYGWAVEYQFAFKPPIVVDDGGDDVLIYPGWSAQVRNAGLREKVSGVIKQILVDDAPVSSPVGLKLDGTKAGPSDDPVYLTFDVHPEAEFADLDLPSDLFTVGTPEIP